MRARTGFLLHPQAAQDIVETWEFIAKDNPAAERRVREELLDAIRALVSFPNQGHYRDDLASRVVRFWRVRNYLIAYAVGEQPLWVLAVLHGSRAPRRITAILKSRT